MSSPDNSSQDDLLKIGQIAGQVGVAVSTLRYYEREGLVCPKARSRAGYRLYARAALEQLRFIRAGQAIGFSLDDIKALLALDQRTSCKQVQSLIEQRMADVDTKLANLRRVRSTLSNALRRCHSSKRGCAVVAELRGESKKRRSK